jgi:hypothetical protein
MISFGPRRTDGSWAKPMPHVESSSKNDAIAGMSPELSVAKNRRTSSSFASLMRSPPRERPASP